jgi:signal transduction histidine kinase
MGRLAGGAVTLASGLGMAWHQQSEGPLTTYAGRSGLSAAAFVTTGLTLALAGLMTSYTRPAARIGDLALFAGFLWFAPGWVGWDRGPALVRSLAEVAAPFFFAVVVHLVVASPSGRARAPAARVLVYAVYVEAGVAALGSALFRDPFFDPGCWANCAENVFVVRSLPRLAHTIQLTDRWFVAAAAGALAAICLWRIVAASWPARRGLFLVACSAMLLAAAVIAHSIVVQRVPVEDPSNPTFFAIFRVACAATILLAAGLGWAALRTRVQRRAVAGIAASLGQAPAPGSLQTALAQAIGDPELRIAYWLPEAQQYVDATGHPVAEPAGRPGHAITALVRDGRKIAAVSHTAALPDLEPELGAAVLLALENERLQAQALAQLDQLRASRVRIVQTGDAERRGLERDLHDGAQQHLLALSYDLRLARAQAQADGDNQTGSLLTEATAHAEAALEELRELAHGIYPAILGEAGLATALATLADAAPLPVEIRDEADQRYPASVETAAYLLIAEAIEDAAGRDASHAAVSVVADGGRLRVTVEDDGSDRTAEMAHLADRIGALDGRLTVEPTRVQVQIPCA